MILFSSTFSFFSDDNYFLFPDSKNAFVALQLQYHKYAHLIGT